MIDNFIQQVPFILYIDMAQPIAFHIFPPRFAKKRTNPKKQRTPSIHREGSFRKCLGKVLAIDFTFPPVYVFQLTREFFTKELKKHYQRNNDTDVFSATWNSVMITVSQTTPVPFYPPFSGHQHIVQPTSSALPGSACFNHPVMSSLAPGLVVEGSETLAGSQSFSNGAATCLERDTPSGCIRVIWFAKAWGIGMPLAFKYWAQRAVEVATRYHRKGSGPFTLQIASELFPANSSQKLSLTNVLLLTAA